MNNQRTEFTVAQNTRLIHFGRKKIRERGKVTNVIPTFEPKIK
jgi:hypothetical protein